MPPQVDCHNKNDESCDKRDFYYNVSLAGHRCLMFDLRFQIDCSNGVTQKVPQVVSHDDKLVQLSVI